MDIFNLARPHIKHIRPYSMAKGEYQVKSIDEIFIDANENPYENKVNRYPDPFQNELKRTIAKIKNVDKQIVFLGNGSDEILDMLIRIFCEPKQDSIVIFKPSFDMYSVLAKINNVNCIDLSLTKEFELPITKIPFTDVKILFLCTPNNPTGNSFKTHNIKKILKNFEGMVVVDEAYIDFSNNQSWLLEINNYPNLIVIQTLSKAYAMAGIRIGMCFANEKVISLLNRVKPPYNISSFAQEKATELLNQPQKIANEIELIKREREMLKSRLITLSIVEKCYDSDANFLLIKMDDANKRYKQLIENNIVVRNRTHLLHCENCLRITIGAEHENNKLIAVLKTLM